MTQICPTCAETEPRIYAHDGEVMTHCCDAPHVIECDDEWTDLALRYFRRYKSWHEMVTWEVML
jgi:hypothetical protein